MAQLPTFNAMRYVQPLREGGSLPAVVDTDGGGLFVVKFRGAGQGPKALVAELIVGLLAGELGLPVPELALVDVPAEFGRSEPDPEIQDLLKASQGVNVGLRYLDGAFNFDGTAAGGMIAPELAARVVWLDALVTNPDRTARNPNLMIWDGRPWLIDHGAALYAHHDWSRVDEARARGPFPLAKDHVLLRRAAGLAAADEELSGVLTEDVIRRVLAAVPDALLAGQLTAGDFATASEARDKYAWYFAERLRAPRAFAASAVEARERAMSEPPRSLSARR
ncbi:MAG TPA: HipA family kinase [Longimicrobiaceae bacterium]|nr:HipA family kinase [Longimicrobiaceae bacterium]